jgi:hypothetical protein
MQTRPKSRLVFLASPETRIIVIRPIGIITGPDFIEQLFEAFARLEAAWTYNRLHDFRRFEGFISPTDLTEIARRWALHTSGITYHARVAFLSDRTQDKIRAHAAADLFLNETISTFEDFYEAMAWLKIFEPIDDTQTDKLLSVERGAPTR